MEFIINHCLINKFNFPMKNQLFQHKQKEGY